MNAGIMLVDNVDVTRQKELLKRKNINKVIVFGGEGVISNDIATSLLNK